jgi:hypothetical protein
LPRSVGAVAGERRHADQRRDLFAIEPSKFGQVRQQGATQDGADAGCGAKQLFFRAPGRAPLDGVIEITIDGRDAALQPPDMVGDLSPDGCL